MQAKEALRVLGVTRPTLSKYVKTGAIKVTKLDNGRYSYNDEDVYAYLTKGKPRETGIYIRGSTKEELKDKRKKLYEYCQGKNYKGKEYQWYTDIGNKENVLSADGFQNLVDDLINGKLNRVVIESKEVFGENYKFVRWLCEKFRCQLEIEEGES